MKRRMHKANENFFVGNPWWRPEKQKNKNEHTKGSKGGTNPHTNKKIGWLSKVVVAG